LVNEQRAGVGGFEQRNLIRAGGDRAINFNERTGCVARVVNQPSDLGAATAGFANQQKMLIGLHRAQQALDPKLKARAIAGKALQLLPYALRLRAERNERQRPQQEHHAIFDRKLFAWVATPPGSVLAALIDQQPASGMAFQDAVNRRDRGIR